MVKIYTGIVLASALGAAVVAAPLTAHASLISIGDSLNGSTINTMATDGGSGSVAAMGMLGNFTIQASALGAPVLPQGNLDTNTLDASSSGAGTLYMYFTEQGLTSPQGMSGFLSSFTSNLINGSIISVTEETFISAANALWTGTLLSSQVFTSAGTSSKFATSPALSGAFSETVEYIIKTSGVGDTNDTVDLSVPVPEPATLGILGLSLGMMAYIVRRRRSL